MFSQNQIDELVEVLETSGEGTKIYLGCDSARIRKNGEEFAKYATVCIVHIDGHKGCKMFKHRSVEPNYDTKQDRPKTRMMNEVIKVCELYNQIISHIESVEDVYEKHGKIYVREFPVEIHLDISTDPKNGSNCAAKEAAGYVLAMTGQEPHLKPDSFAASFGGDWVVNKNW